MTTLITLNGVFYHYIMKSYLKSNLKKSYLKKTNEKNSKYLHTFNFKKYFSNFLLFYKEINLFLWKNLELLYIKYSLKIWYNVIKYNNELM